MGSWVFGVAGFRVRGFAGSGFEVPGFELRVRGFGCGVSWFGVSHSGFEFFEVWG